MRKSLLALVLAAGVALGLGVDHLAGNAIAAQVYQRITLSSTYVSPTTSAQLRGVISDETGTGAAIFAGGNVGDATFERFALSGSTAVGAAGSRWMGPAASTDGWYINVPTGGNIGLALNNVTRLNINGAGAQLTGALTISTPLAVAQGGIGDTTARGGAANLGVPYVFSQSAVQVITPADTNENTAHTCTVPAGGMGPNGRVRIRGTASFSNDTGIKNVFLRFGGVAGTDYLVSFGQQSIAGLEFRGEIANRNSASSQVGQFVISQSNNAIGYRALTTSAVNTANATDIVIRFQKVEAGDTAALESIICEVIYGAFLSLDRFMPESRAVAANDALYAYLAAA
jgi:hypothetical protein